MSVTSNLLTEAEAMRDAFRVYIKSHATEHMDPDARKRKRNAFVAGWKAARKAFAYKVEALP